MPFRNIPSEEGLVHGVNERISLDSLRSGMRSLYELVHKLAAERASNRGMKRFIPKISAGANFSRPKRLMNWLKVCSLSLVQPPDVLRSFGMNVIRIDAAMKLGDLVPILWHP